MRGALMRGALYKGELMRGALYEGELMRGALYEGELVRGALNVDGRDERPLGWEMRGGAFWNVELR